MCKYYKKKPFFYNAIPTCESQKQVLILGILNHSEHAWWFEVDVGIAFSDWVVIRLPSTKIKQFPLQVAMCGYCNFLLGHYPITFNQNQGGFCMSLCVNIASYKTILRMQYIHPQVDLKNGKQKNFITTNYVLNFKIIQIKS